LTWYKCAKCGEVQASMNMIKDLVETELAPGEYYIIRVFSCYACGHTRFRKIGAELNGQLEIVSAEPADTCMCKAEAEKEENVVELPA